MNWNWIGFDWYFVKERRFLGEEVTKNKRIKNRYKMQVK
jgi:hypothetical protein